MIFFVQLQSFWRNCSIQKYFSSVPFLWLIPKLYIGLDVAMFIFFPSFFHRYLLWLTMKKTLPKLSVWHLHEVLDSLGWLLRSSTRKYDQTHHSSTKNARESADCKISSLFCLHCAQTSVRHPGGCFWVRVAFRSLSCWVTITHDGNLLVQMLLLLI